MAPMMRATMLLLLAGFAHAGIELYEVDKGLWPNGVEYSLEAPAAEVHLVFAFRSGLYALAGRGDAGLATAAFVVEYNDADRSTCYWNRYRPLPFDADSNPKWVGASDAPGLFETEGASAELTERTLVVRLPRVNRWRIRVTPLLGDTELVRRVPALVQVAEVRDAKPRVFEELDPLPVAEEEVVPAQEEATEEEPGEETVEDTGPPEAEGPVAWTTVESIGGTTIRGIRSGSVARGDYARNAFRGAGRRGWGWGQKGQASRTLKGYRTPLNGSPVAGTIPPFGGPVAGTVPPFGAPVAGTIPSWGAPLPFWAVPKARAAGGAPRHVRAPPTAGRAP